MIGLIEEKLHVVSIVNMTIGLICSPIVGAVLCASRSHVIIPLFIFDENAVNLDSFDNGLTTFSKKIMTKEARYDRHFN